MRLPKPKTEATDPKPVRGVEAESAVINSKFLQL